MEYFIGFKNGSQFFLNDGLLTLPVVSLGLSGSGKTITIKAIIEEMAMNGIPSILIDSQGDLVLLDVPCSKEEFVNHGGDINRLYDYCEKTVVNIYTPCSSKGHTISFSPLIQIPDGLDNDEKIVAIDSVCSNLLLLMDYKQKTDDFKMARQVLYDVIMKIMDNNMFFPRSISELIKLINELYPNPKQHHTKLIRRLTDIEIGQNNLLFRGHPIEIDNMIRPQNGKTPINVIYLNTLTTEQQIQFVVSSIMNIIYRWMLMNPKKSESPILAVFIDEASKFFPPYPRNTPSKEPIKKLMKEGRKYHVITFIASQNYTDIDYKGMTQAGLYFLGRLVNRNDLENISSIIEPNGINQSDIKTIPKGEIYVIDSFGGRVKTRIKNRWLYSEHGTPIASNEIEDMIEKARKRRLRLLCDRNKEKIKVRKCPICLSVVHDTFYFKEYNKYLCYGCKRWFLKEEFRYE